MAVDLASLQAELETVNKAVTAAYSGSEYDIASGTMRRHLVRQKLDVLLARKRELETAIGRLDGTSGRGPSVGVVVDSAASPYCDRFGQ